MKGIRQEKKASKMSHLQRMKKTGFADTVILYLENSRNSSKKLINQFSKVYMQKSVAYHSSNKDIEKEIGGNPFIERKKNKLLTEFNRTVKHIVY